MTGLAGEGGGVRVPPAGVGGERADAPGPPCRVCASTERVVVTMNREREILDAVCELCHRLEHPSKAERRLTCEVCGRGYTSKSRRARYCWRCRNATTVKSGKARAAHVVSRT